MSSDRAGAILLIVGSAVFLIGAAVRVVGALASGWSLYLRATRVSDFAFGTLPAWPFLTSVLLTIGGIALLAFGLLAGDFRSWLGWATLAADAVFLAGYLYLSDIPPFVFYLLFTVVGLAVL